MIAISFASNNYITHQQNWNLNFSQNGFVTRCYRPDNIGFLNNFIYGDRGYGYWIWKPYIILDALQTNDSVFYSDIDYTLNNFERLINLLKDKEHLLFEYPFNNRNWIKRDCYYFMGADSEEYYNSNHLEAGLQFWTKTDNNINILNEWFEYCKNKAIISDDENICGLPNLPEFKDHRHDQAILSILKHKYKLTTLPLNTLVGTIGNL